MYFCSEAQKISQHVCNTTNPIRNIFSITSPSVCVEAGMQ
jgi:hypothetical protein